MLLPLANIQKNNSGWAY